MPSAIVNPPPKEVGDITSITLAAFGVLANLISFREAKA